MVDRWLPGRRSALALATLAVLSSTAWTVSSEASEFPAVLPLSSIDKATGFRVTHTPNPAINNDNFGRSVAASDVNGDGLSDIVIGPGGDFQVEPSPQATAGTMVFGNKVSIASGSIDTSDLNGKNGFRFCAEPSTNCYSNELYALQSVVDAGDVNGDGFGDFLVSSNNASEATYNGFVVFGKGTASPPIVDLLMLNGSNGFSFSENDNSCCDTIFGAVVAGGGDINGDGFDDVVLSDFVAPSHSGVEVAGATYVVFGKAAGFSSTVNVSTLNGHNGFRISGTTALQFSGWSLAIPGDINGDGFADIVIGAVNDGSGPPYPGEAFVVFGKAAGFDANLSLSDLNGRNGFRLVGEPFDSVGWHVAGVGDFNGDGLADFSAGCYVIFGKRSGFGTSIKVSSLGSRSSFRLNNANCQAIAGVGDMNGDGFDDLADDQNVLFGKLDLFDGSVDISNLDGSNGFRLKGKGATSRFSMANAQDFSGDGIGDLLIGDASSSSPSELRGGAYVIYGRLPDSPRRRVGAAGDQHISGGSFKDRLSGLGGDDVLEGRGGGDGLDGGLGSDTASYDHAESGVTANLATPAKNKGDAKEDSYVSVENLEGSSFGDTLVGNGLANRISGHGGNDRLSGLAGADVLIGNGGADWLRGGTGPDRFVYRAPQDSRVGLARDVITDFDGGSPGAPVDQIDLRAIDAKSGQEGDQAFAIIGNAPFTHTEGELRISATGTSAIVSGDVNGDGVADFEIELANFTDLAKLTALSFKL